MVVGVLKIAFFLRGSRSLKDKRHVLKKMKDRLIARFNIAIAEVEANDTWERFYLGVAALGDDRRQVNSILDTVKSELNDSCLAQVVDSKFELISLF
jgi:uncharacterized protein